MQVALVDTYARDLAPVAGDRARALGVIAVSFVIAWWLARPVGRLARAAESMSGSALHQPVPHERLYREAALLSDLARPHRQRQQRQGRSPGMNRRVIRMIIGAVAVVVALVIIVGEQVAGVSSDAAINAQVPILAPTDGEIAMQVRTLGTRVAPNEPPATLSDPRPRRRPA